MDSLAAKAAQLVFPRLGSNMPPPVTVDEDFDRFEKLLKKYPFGGIVLFNGEASTLHSQLQELQKLSPKPFLVGSDIERGVGQQVKGGSIFPHAMAFSALPEKRRYKLIEAFGLITGKEALACGIHIAFAPVADINLDPDNPIISIRSFGTDQDIVAKSIAAYIAGCRRAGLLTTLKHFPGHGNTDKDSHAELPTVSSTAEALFAQDIKPYETTISRGTCDLVMTSHVRFPALDPSGEPATGSHAMLVDILRKKLAFNGPVITDSLIMKAIQNYYPSSRHMATALINAGVDILLDPPEPEEMVQAIVASVKDGDIAMQRLDEAISRIESIKKRIGYRMGCASLATAHQVFAPSLVGCDAHTTFAQEFAREILPPPLPSLPDSSPVILFKSHTHRFDPPQQPLYAFLKRMKPTISYYEYGPEFSAKEEQFLKGVIANAKQVVLIAIVKPAAWHKHGLSVRQEQFVNYICNNTQKVVNLVSMGSPYWLETYNHRENVQTTCTYSDVDVSQQALAEYLFAE